MEPIKPKEITLKSQVLQDDRERTFRISRYPATEGVELFMMAAEVLGAMAKPSSSSNISAEKTKAFVIKICGYVESQMPSGDYIKLNSKLLIDAHIPDYEMLFKIVREVHDYNSFFFNSGRLLKTSLSLMDQAKLLISKTLTQFSQPSSVKKSPRSKS